MRVHSDAGIVIRVRTDDLVILPRSLGHCSSEFVVRDVMWFKAGTSPRGGRFHDRTIAENADLEALSLRFKSCRESDYSTANDDRFAGHGPLMSTWLIRIEISPLSGSPSSVRRSLHIL